VDGYSRPWLDIWFDLMRPFFAIPLKRDHALAIPAAFTGSKLGFIPRSIINPAEPGTNYDAAFPGRGTGIPAITQLSASIANDGTADLLVATPDNGGGTGNGIPDGSATARTGRILVQDWRRKWIIGGDFSPAAGSGAGSLLLKMTKPACEYALVQGVRVNFPDDIEADGIGITGNTSGADIVVDVLDCPIWNTNGTNKAHDAGRAVSSIAMSAGGVLTATVASVTSPSTIAVGDDVTVYAGSFASAFSTTWRVASISGTVLTLSNPYGRPLPANGTSASGTLWRFDGAASGWHGDPIQVYMDGRIRRLRVDRVSAYANYQLAPKANYNAITGLGCRYLEVGRYNAVHIDKAPQDYGSLVGLFGDHDGSAQVGASSTLTYCDATLYDVWLYDGRAGRTAANTLSPQAGSTVDGLPMGVLTETIASVVQAWWQNHPACHIYGVVKYAARPAGDFAPWGTPGAGVAGYGYISPGYYGRPSTPSALPAITVSGASFAADAPRGALLGYIDLPGIEDGWIVDVYLTDDAGGRVQVWRNQLQRGRVASDAGTFTCTLRATVRGFPAVYRDLTVTVTVTAASGTPVYASLANAEAKAAVRAMYALPTGSQCGAIDSLFSSLKALNSGLAFAKIKGLYFFAATSDQRDAGFNWVAPGAVDLHENNTPRLWTAKLGFAGSSTNKFLMNDIGWTTSALGLSQDAASMMVGYALKNPDTSDGALASGTDYIAGNDKFFIGATSAGAIICQCNNSGAKTTSTTPLAGVGGAVQVIAMTRQSGTGFDLMRGTLSSSLSSPLGVNGAQSTQQSTSGTPSTYPIVAYGRNNAGALNYCTKTVPFIVLGTNWTNTEAEGIRAALATYATGTLGLS
jgi:hypothetical protein